MKSEYWIVEYGYKEPLLIKIFKNLSDAISFAEDKNAEGMVGYIKPSLEKVRF
jgi:hypothetical protein